MMRLHICPLNNSRQEGMADEAVEWAAPVDKPELALRFAISGPDRFPFELVHSAIYPSSCFPQHVPGPCLRFFISSVISSFVLGSTHFSTGGDFVPSGAV
jgi:hypothetical protein